MLDRAPRDDDREVLSAWGDVIRRHRKWKRWSRRELAEHAGVSPVFLGEIERGEKDASTHTLLRISAALGVPLSDLYLRVGAQLSGRAGEVSAEQTSLPLLLREEDPEYLAAVPPAKDETAYDLYTISRHLPTEQLVSLLVLARSLSKDQA